MIIVISGISGVGKSTISRKLLDELNQNNKWVWIDQDKFFKKDKPKIKLSNGNLTSNWDCKESIDWEKLNKCILDKNKNYNVIFSGFCILKTKIEFPISHHIHLIYENKSDILEMEKYCIISRSNSKNWNEHQKERDILVVKELVIPFYLESLNEFCEIDLIIQTISDQIRLPCEHIIGNILKSINFQ